MDREPVENISYMWPKHHNIWVFFHPGSNMNRTYGGAFTLKVADHENEEQQTDAESGAKANSTKFQRGAPVLPVSN